tara:strand:+ start:35750 stop:36697 length:948 start_codon:yes stop_codon:yes gene_type:complete
MITPRLLANLVGVSYKKLIWLARACREDYRDHYLFKEVRVPKGRTSRQVFKVSKSLKQIHSKLKTYLEDVIPSTGGSYAYERGVGIDVAANRLVGHKLLITADFVNHFHSVRLTQVKATLVHHGFTDRVAYLISRLACITDRGRSFLPQGSVISPLLSNRVCEHLLDPIILKKFPDAKYTRYSDNVYLGFDTNRKSGVEVLSKLNDISASLGWRCHKRKILPYYKQQKALGFVCNERPNMTKKAWLTLKAVLHKLALGLTGIELKTAFSYFGVEDAESLVRCLEGKLNYWKPYLAPTRLTLIETRLNEIKETYIV